MAEVASAERFALLDARVVVAEGPATPAILPDISLPVLAAIDIPNVPNPLTPFKVTV